MSVASSRSPFPLWRTLFLLLAVVAAALLGMLFLGESEQQTRAANEDELWQLRNLGKAFYENPTTQKEAVETFRKALDLAPGSVREQLNYGLALMHAGDSEEGIRQLLAVQQKAPSIPHPWFVLGVHYRKSGEDEKALAQFQQMAKLVPDEAKTQYNLGVLYKQRGENAQAIAQFERAAELQPTLAAPHFQLFNMYRLAGDREKANARLARFREIKQQQEGAVIPEDMDWSEYAEIYDPVDPQQVQADQVTAPRLGFALDEVASGVDTASAGSLVLDAAGDGTPALLVWDKDGARLFRQAMTPVPSDVLASLRGVRDIAAGDFDNDGLTDLAVVSASGVRLLRNTGGAFAAVGEGPMASGDFRKALWLDYDHDYDLDLILLGAKSTVYRNQGQAGFQAREGAIPFVDGTAIGGVVVRQTPDSKAMDFAVSYAGRGGVLYADRLGGAFEARELSALPAGAVGLHAADFNSDGRLDLAARANEQVLLIANENSGWKLAKALPAGGDFTFADPGNLGVRDLVGNGVVLANNSAQFGRSRESNEVPLRHALVSADFDGDGRVDLAGVSAEGAVLRLRNTTESSNRWLRVQLAGVKAPKEARGAIVEVKAGPRYQKFFYAGVPLHVGIRGFEKVDTIRITWPNGLIQNEMNQETSKAYRYEEAQRLSGSCPMIFTWNGRKFTFITDVLGVAPLGAKSGDGSYFPTNSDEYIWIDGEQLVAQEGRLRIRITEELGEVSYLDQLQLIAVDHPANVDVFSNEKWKSPPYPEFRLFGTPKRVYPQRALSQGADVRETLLRRDQRYVNNFARSYQNVAEMHALELDFGSAAAENRAFLVLNGWVDWADGSTFLAREQEGDGGLVPPYLQVRNEKGEWQTVIEDLGMPSGKTKTLAVDLSGKFLTKDRSVRIVTNLCVFWDEVFLGENAASPEVKLTALPAVSAELRYHGFSTSVIHPQRKKPEHFEYEPTTVLSYWNPTSGNYTRYGDVLELITEIDDRYIIMGAADETALEYDAAAAPALPTGWRRDYLLRVEGWAKDADANTGFGQSVEPLPFHKMTRYPYPPKERYPDSEVHRQYRETYNTRPAMRYTRSLVDRAAEFVR